MITRANGTNDASALGMIAVRRLVPVLSTLIAFAAGCGALDGDENPTVGLASIKFGPFNFEVL